MKAKPLIFKVISIISYIILALLVFIVVFLVYMRASNKIPIFMDHGILRIISPSMEPVIPVDSYILIKTVDPSTLEIGDIISFYSKDELIYMKPNTHQIVEIISEGDKLFFKTKGTNNPSPDPLLVSSDDIIGEYQKTVASLSKIGSLVNNPKIFLVIVVVPAGVFFVIELYNFVKKIKKEPLSEDEQEE